MAVHILDIVQGLPKLQKCMKIFLQNLRSHYDVWNNTKKERHINRSRNIHIYPPGSCKKAVTIQKPKLLARSCASFPNIVTNFFLSASSKLFINDTYHALRLLAFTLESSGIWFICLDIGSNILQKSGLRIFGAEQRFFWASGSSFHLKFVGAVQNHAVPQLQENILHRIYWS